MQLSEMIFEAGTPITGYGPGFFRVGEEAIEGAMIVLPERAMGWTGLDNAEALVGLAEEVDVILLGMGDTIAHPPSGFRETVEAAGLGLEVMASDAACRTYNVLLGEGRRIAAALLPMGG